MLRTQAEVPGLSKYQLDALTSSVELRRQQLEQDIAAYIQARQDELARYEQEVYLHFPGQRREDADVAAAVSAAPLHGMQRGPARWGRPARRKRRARPDRRGGRKG
jgi:Tfp pilus assembly protein PilV